MTKRLPTIIAFIAIFAGSLLYATHSSARSYTPETVPNAQLSDARHYVSDPDGILSSETIDLINGMCVELRKEGLAEVAVVVLGSVEEEELDLFAHRVLNLWEVGQKGADNGFVMSVVRDQRDIQFETGYGLEGVLPDAICKRIQTEEMIPLLQAGDWDAGVLAGLEAVYNVLVDNSAELAALSADHGAGGGKRNGRDDIQDSIRSVISGILLFFSPLVLIGLVIVVILLLSGVVFAWHARPKTCPACGAKRGLRFVNWKTVEKTATHTTHELVRRCKICGHEERVRRTVKNDSGGSGSSGGRSRGSFSGSRRSGGSFGGGRSGGGGSRSRF